MDAKLLARALRAAADVLDSAPAATAPTMRHASRGAAEAFEARTDRKTCEPCGQRIERGARVVWGREKGAMVHEACAGTPQNRTVGERVSVSSSPADDFDAAGGEEIPF